MSHGQVLEFSGVTKRYGKVTAVSDFSARVQPGVVTGFLGPNGAGKTTTLRILLGLVSATSGTATIGGSTYRGLKNPLQTVGAALEATSFHPGRTARNHLKVYATAGQISHDRIDEVLAEVELTEAADRKVGGFSLGMRQRLGLATALLGNPDVLVLDEPSNGLDPEGIKWMRTFLREQAREGRTVLVSSHMLSEIQQIADNVIIISQGRKVFEGELGELMSMDATEVVTVDSPDRAGLAAALRDAGMSPEVLRSGLTVRGATTADIGAAAAAAGIALSSLAKRGASVEDIFFDLVSGARSQDALAPVTGEGDSPEAVVDASTDTSPGEDVDAVEAQVGDEPEAELPPLEDAELGAASLDQSSPFGAGAIAGGTAVAGAGIAAAAAAFSNDENSGSTERWADTFTGPIAVADAQAEAEVEADADESVLEPAADSGAEAVDVASAADPALENEEHEEPAVTGDDAESAGEAEAETDVETVVESDAESVVETDAESVVETDAESVVEIDAEGAGEPGAEAESFPATEDELESDDASALAGAEVADTTDAELDEPELVGDDAPGSDTDRTAEGAEAVAETEAEAETETSGSAESPADATNVASAWVSAAADPIVDEAAEAAVSEDASTATFAVASTGVIDVVDAAAADEVDEHGDDATDVNADESPAADEEPAADTEQWASFDDLLVGDVSSEDEISSPAHAQPEPDPEWNSPWAPVQSPWAPQTTPIATTPNADEHADSAADSAEPDVQPDVASEHEESGEVDAVADGSADDDPVVTNDDVDPDATVAIDIVESAEHGAPAPVTSVFPPAPLGNRPEPVDEPDVEAEAEVEVEADAEAEAEAEAEVGSEPEPETEPEPAPEAEPEPEHASEADVPAPIHVTDVNDAWAAEATRPETPESPWAPREESAPAVGSSDDPFETASQSVADNPFAALLEQGDDVEIPESNDPNVDPDAFVDEDVEDTFTTSVVSVTPAAPSVMTTALPTFGNATDDASAAPSSDNDDDNEGDNDDNNGDAERDAWERRTDRTPADDAADEFFRSVGINFADPDTAETPAEPEEEDGSQQ